MIKKSNGVAKQIILLCTPFVLYAISIILLALFVFGAFIASSPVYSALINEQINDYSKVEIDEITNTIIVPINT